MKFALNEKKFHILIFSLTCCLIIFTINKSFNISQVGLRQLIDGEKYKKRCENTLRKFREKYSDTSEYLKTKNSTSDKPDKYQRTLKGIIQDQKYDQITKYLPQILIYLIVAIIDIIFIIFWILFCCYSCKTMPKQNRIGCGAKCSFIIFFVLCIGILGFCVIGFIYMPYLTKGLNALACSIYRLVFHFLEGIDDGNKELKWIGLEKIHENITNIEKGNYESSLEKVSNMIDTFKEIKNKTLDDIEEILKAIDDYGIYISIATFGGMGAFTLLILLSIFMIFVCECKCMSCLFHLFWNLEIILIIFTFASAAVLGSFSVVSRDLSVILIEQGNNITKNDAFIFNYTKIKDEINICLNEDGNLYKFLFNTDDKVENELNEWYNCSFFKMDYNILTEELRDTIAKKLYFVSLIIIIIDAAGIIAIFFGIGIYNSQKEYYPPSSNDVNINNNRMMNNRIDLSSENLKKQNNEVIFSKNIK